MNDLHALGERELAGEGNQAALFRQMAFSIDSKWARFNRALFGVSASDRAVVGRDLPG